MTTDYYIELPKRRWTDVGFRRISGLVIGGIGLVAGLVAAFMGTGWLAAAAGVAALIAGAISFSAATAIFQNDQRQAEAQQRSVVLENRLSELGAKLNAEERSHADTRRALDEYMSENPPPGSFDRKLSDQETPITGRMGTVSPTDTRLLADPETNLFSEAYFRVALDARIASARRHLRPVAVALVQVTEGAGHLDTDSADPTKVTGSIRQTLRDADTACRMSDGTFALILEDTPENGAVWTVERIRRNLISRHGQHTLWAGVACYPAHAFSTDELLDQASLALDAAREWKQDRIEVANAE
jgi:two-component system cell cycle response regulator